jgi:solute carrier family 25 folate transporter 32
MPSLIAFSSSLCKVMTSFITYPHEVIRSRQQDSRAYDESKIDQKTRASLRYVIRQASKEGVGAFYAGWTANLFRIVPHYAITFVLYESLSQFFHKKID